MRRQPKDKSTLTMLCLALGVILVTKQALAAPVELRGQVVKVDQQQRETRAVGVMVTLRGEGNPVTTRQAGDFRMVLPESRYRVGQGVDLEVDLKGWQVWQPVGGHAVIPLEPQRDLVVLKLRPVGSPEFFSREGITDLVRSVVTQVRTQAQREESAQKIDPLGASIREWAGKYGFSVEQVHEQVERWVTEVKALRGADAEQRCLVLVAEMRYGDAGRCFTLLAESDEPELQRLKQAAQAQTERVVRRLLQAGGAYEGDLDFRAALAAYHKAQRQVSRDGTRELWAEIQSNLGNVQEQLGIQIEGAEGNALLAQAVVAYRDALQVYSYVQEPQAWAMTQSNLGRALREQASRSSNSGEEGARLLAQAAVAYREALQVYTHAQLPHAWAMTQNNLGNTLLAQARRSSGEERARLLAQAVVAYRDALQVYTRAQFPQAWAMTQNNLGNALSEQGTRSGGEGTRLLAQAVVAYREALQVRTHAQQPQGWATTQNSMGNALCEQARRSEEEGARLLTQAVVAYREALQVYTRAQFPQAWATTQNNLGSALSDLALRSSAAERSRLFSLAVATLRSGLEVHTFSASPVEWRQTVDNLMITCRQMKDLRCFVESVATLRQATPDDPVLFGYVLNLYHDRLFEFSKAFDLCDDWLMRHPDVVRIEREHANRGSHERGN